MRIFKSKRFSKWAKSEAIDEELLKEVIIEIGRGLYETNLGAGLYKKRIARKGEGKRGGYRTLIAFKMDDKAIFMYGFAKNEQDNVGIKEIEVYKKLAKHYLDLTETQLNILVKKGEFFEVVL